MISFVYCLLIPLFLYLVITFARTTKLYELKLFLSYLVAILVISSYLIAPPSDWDLYRHFGMLDEIRIGGFSFYEYLFEYSSIYNIEYTFLYVFNAIEYLFSKCCDDNQILPAVINFVNYSILAYIYIDWYRNHLRINGIILTALLISFTLLPFIYADSGLRNGLAASITALSIYKYLYRKCALGYLILGIMLASMIHPSILFVLPILFLSKRSPRGYGFLLSLSIYALMPYIGELFLSSSIPLVNLLGLKYQAYSNLTQENMDVSSVFLVGTLCICGICIIYNSFIDFRLINLRKYSITDTRLINFLTWSCFYVMGNMGNYDLVLRPAYVLSFFSPMIVDWLHKTRIGKGLLLFLLVVALYATYRGFDMIG